MRRKVSEHPAATVEEHEPGEHARHTGRADDDELHGLAIGADAPFRDVRSWKVDPDARLGPDQHRARFGRGQLLHRLAAIGREGFQKDLDVSLDSRTSGRAVRHAATPLSGGDRSCEWTVHEGASRVFDAT
jgi:hypothetical protein